MRFQRKADGRRDRHLLLLVPVLVCRLFFSSGERLFRGMAKAEMGLGRNNRAVGAFDIRNTGACGLQASESRMAGSFAVGTCRGRVL